MLSHYLKKGAHNTLFYGLSSVVSRAFSFIFLPYFLAKLSLEEFGIWDFYQMFFSMGTLVLSSTAATGMIRYFLLYKDNQEKQQQAIGNSFCFIFVLALFFQLGSFAILNLYYYNHPNYYYLLITTANITFFALFSMLLAYFRVKEYLWCYFLVFCGQNLLAILFTVFAVKSGFGIDGFFYANGISFMLFLPGFLYLFNKYRSYSFSLFKNQIFYSLPLLVYGMLYSFFFSIDRFFIKEYGGYESLGTYSLLWRFGSIFQFFSIALMDASPVVFFNAQKEENGNHLIARIINYFCIILSTACIITIIGAKIGIQFLFPIKYYFLIPFLPIFFLPIVFIEFARVFQLGIGLSTKTIYGPLLTGTGLAIQSVLLFTLKSFKLPGIMLANSISFALFAVLANWISSSIYSPNIFNKQKIIKILACFGFYVGLLQLIFLYNAPLYLLVGFIFSWPLMLWHFVIDKPDKQKFKLYSLQQLDKIISRRKKHNTHISELKKVLYLKTDIYYHNISSGGSITHTLGVISGLNQLGCIIICATACMKNRLKKITEHFQELHIWPIFFFLRWKIGFLRWHADCFVSTFIFAWQTRKLFKSHSIDAIYQRYSWLNCTGVLLSYFKKVPLILEYNGSEVWIAKKSQQRSFGFLWLATVMEKFNLRYADYIVVVSQAQKHELLEQQIDEKKILVNPNGVDHEIFNPTTLETDRTFIRKQLNLENKFVFGFIGTFSFWHGIETIAAMIPALLQNKLPVHFILIGDGALRPNLSKQVQSYSNHVTFTGMLDQTKAKEYLAACDAFLCPTQPNNDGSRFFGSPTKLFEYMSMAKPIIASNLEQIGTIIKPALHLDSLKKLPTITNQIGILIDPNKTEDFIEAAHLLLQMQNTDCQKLGQNARAHVAQSFTWNKHVQKIANFTQSKIH